MLTSAQVGKMAGKKWSTDFTPGDVAKVFQECGPLEGAMFSSFFSPSWFISKIFNNQQGKPLELLPFQMVMLNMLWYKKFPMVIASRGAGKTFMLALYSLLKAILVPGSKIVIVGAGFRQAKLVFRYIEQLYNASPLIQESISYGGGPKYGSDAATLKVGLSLISAIPIGDGEKIRGMRATVLIADEFASIPEDIFDIVISPFTAVHANPAERAKTTAFVNRLRALKADPTITDAIDTLQGFGNQIIISGTPSHKHNHFYKRHEVYKMFINSAGDPKALKRALEQRSLASTGKVNEVSNDDVKRMVKTWRQYCIYQLPYQGLPEGFLDEDVIRSDRAAFPPYRFAMEYEAKFPDDSDGFIKRSWIERATPTPDIETPDAVPIIPELYGDPRFTYVLGLDAARWNDNFGAIVLKLTSRGKELVYCNAWDRTEYHVSADKIREICKRFPVSYIAMDKGGGGDATYEWLFKKQPHISDDELIWLHPDQQPDKSLLGAPGRKILELVNFSPTWIQEAAHSVEASIQQCDILFPNRGDEISIYDQYMRHFQKNEVTEGEKSKLNIDLWGMDDWEAEQLSAEVGKKIRSTFGTMQHITECINETCAIVRSVTPGGTEKFELPKLAEQPEGLDMRRRDRWSALMLANYAAKIVRGSGHKNKSIVGVQPGQAGGMGSYGYRGRKQRGSVSW